VQSPVLNTLGNAASGAVVLVRGDADQLSGMRLRAKDIWPAGSALRSMGQPVVVRLSGATFVTMVKTADLRNRDHTTCALLLTCLTNPTFGSIMARSEVGRAHTTAQAARVPGAPIG
jgi:hypothetical protein